MARILTKERSPILAHVAGPVDGDSVQRCLRCDCPISPRFDGQAWEVGTRVVLIPESKFGRAAGPNAVDCEGGARA